MKKHTRIISAFLQLNTSPRAPRPTSSSEGARIDTSVAAVTQLGSNIPERSPIMRDLTIEALARLCQISVATAALSSARRNLAIEMKKKDLLQVDVRITGIDRQSGRTGRG